MAVQECSLTLSSNLFLSELYDERSRLDNNLVNVIDTVLIDGTIPNANFQVRRSSFDGFWSFWEDLHEVEKDCTLNYSPLFNDYPPSDGYASHQLELSERIIEEHQIEDSKLTCRIVFYPFGLLVIRLRAYLYFGDEIEIEELISLANILPKEIGRRLAKKGPFSILLGEDSTESLFKSIFEEFLSAAFLGGKASKSAVPDEYWGQLGSINPFPIIYIYDDEQLSDSETAKLIKLDRRNLAARYVESITSPVLGHLENDTIVVSKQGALLQTPYFSSISSANRRWKRMQLLNNIYLASELANFERDFGYKYTNILQSTLDELNSGTVIGTPIQPKYLVMMRESLLLGPRLCGVRNRVYDELSPNNHSQYISQIDEYTNRIIDHSSMVRDGIKKLAPGLIN